MDNNLFLEGFMTKFAEVEKNAISIGELAGKGTKGLLQRSLLGGSGNLLSQAKEYGKNLMKKEMPPFYSNIKYLDLPPEQRESLRSGFKQVSKRFPKGGIGTKSMNTAKLIGESVKALIKGRKP